MGAPVASRALWTPWRNVVANAVARKLWPGRSLWTPWRIRGQWYWLRDRASSVTLKIAFEEVSKGFYTPQVDLRPGDWVLDIGAHVGTFSIPLAREHPDVHFLAFEPNPENYANLVRNLRANRIKNVIALNEGVWSGASYLVNEQDPRNTGGSRTRPAAYGGEDGEVRAQSLQAIRESWALHGIRVLKMDCEGAEYQALRAPADLAGVDCLLLEVHGGNPAPLLALARAVKHHRIQILQDSHVTITSEGDWRPKSLGVPI